MNKVTTLSEVFSTYILISIKPLGDNKGEDAYVFSFVRDDLHMQAVFDGCGGAGSWQYPEYHDATGAFIAAQSLAKWTETWFTNIKPDTVEQMDLLAESYHDMAFDQLANLRDHSSPVGIRGTMVKAFPSTASLAIMKCTESSCLY